MKKLNAAGICSIKMMCRGLFAASKNILSIANKFWYFRPHTLTVLFLLIFFSNSEAAITPKKENSLAMKMSKMMYFDFGLGIGTATKWSKSSFAVDAMTMGIYVFKDLGFEVGMGSLTNGIYQDHGSRINNVHFSAKKELQFNRLLMPYGKLGVGVSLGQGHQNEMDMITTNVGPFYGAGILLKLTEHISLYCEDSGIVVIPGRSRSFGSVNQGTIGIQVGI